MGNVNGEKSKRGPAASWIIDLFLFIFLYNGYTFLNTDGNDHPLVGSLFNMIIALSIFFFIYHKEDLEKEKASINGVCQASLDKYFNIFKKTK